MDIHNMNFCGCRAKPRVGPISSPFCYRCTGLLTGWLITTFYPWQVPEWSLVIGGIIVFYEYTLVPHDHRKLKFMSGLWFSLLLHALFT